MTTSYDDLIWRETSPGVWGRSVDEIEHFYFAFARLFSGSGRQGFFITGHMTITAAIPEGQTQEQANHRLDNALKQAWLSLRYECPTVAAQVIQNSDDNKLRKVYNVCRTDAEQNTWLNNTLVHIRTGQTGAQWANSDPPFPDLPTLLVDQANVDGDMYRGPLLDGSEVKNLSPSYRIAANVPPQLSETQKKRLAEMTVQKAAAAKEKPGVRILTLPYKRGSTRPGQHQREAVTLSRDQTAALIATCKERNATVTHAYHAAIAIVLRDLQERGAETMPAEYVRYILRNERQSCVEPYNTAKHAAAVYHSVSGQALVVEMALPAAGVTIDLPERKAEFLRILEVMVSFYEEVRNDVEHPQLAPFIWGERPLPLPEPGVDPTTRPVPPPAEDPSASISSMGLVDNLIKPDRTSIQAYDPWVTGEELGNGLGLFLGTYRGELCLSAAYNEAWHDQETVPRQRLQCKLVADRDDLGELRADLDVNEP
ncbi:hypothetical protein GQ53DRAFT_813260 [Thozetella sp. PMI_491]|nr:hypothetical protein GQ53DRAFT_813260 [Thozetella sp. PMI_491]